MFNRKTLSVAIALNFGTLSLGTLSTTAWAAGEDQNKTRIDEQIVVTGTKIPTKVSELTHSVTVINEQDISRYAYTDVTEVLRKMPGIEFKHAGGVGQYNYLKMRGLGSSNILIVVDGVKINKASSGDTGNLLSQLDPDTIESLEVLRGPQATLYGANSSAGVIVIKTKSGTSPAANLELESGSKDWRKASLSLRNQVEAGAGKWLYSLNVSDTDSDNTHSHEFFEDTTIQFKTSYETETFKVGLSVYELDNSFGFAELSENNNRVNSRSLHWAYQTPDPDQRNDAEESIYSVFAEHQITSRLSQRLQVSRAENTSAYHDRDNGLLGTQVATVDGIVPGARKGDTLYIYDRRYPGISLTPLDLNDPANAIDDTHAYYKDRSDQVDYNLLYNGEGYDLLGGVEYIEQEASQWGSYGSSDNDDAQISYYANGNLYLLDNTLVLSAGMRMDDYDSWGTETTGNIGFAWHLAEHTTLYGNTGTSFRPATMSQLFNPTSGDASLAPESGDTVELGIRHYAMDNRLYAEATLWKTEIDDVIFYDYSVFNPRSYNRYGQYNNGAAAETSGLELQFSYQLTDSLLLDGNYTYTDSHNKAVGGNWQRAVQIARNKGNLGLSYASGPLSLSANAYYSGPRLRWAGDVEMQEYVRVDLSGRYQLHERVALTLRVENLFDEDIEEGLGYEEPGIYTVVGVNVSLL